MGGSIHVCGGVPRPQAEKVPRRQRDQALTRHLRREESISTRELLGLGFSKDEITGLVAHGDLRRVFRGVYVAGRSKLAPWSYLHAARRAVGPAQTSFISHRTAAAARRYRPINVRDIHVSVVAASTPQVSGLTVHRTDEPGPGEVTVLSGIRVASLPRILVEIAATASVEELDDLITQGERRGALDAMAPVLARHGRRHGIGRLRACLVGHVPAPGYNSDLERRVWAWYGAQPGLPPPDETNVHIGPFEFDGLWRRQRFVLEIDSRTYHQARADMEKDRIKDAYVQKHGFRILRITDMRFDHARAGIRADLVAFLLGPVP